MEKKIRIQLFSPEGSLVSDRLVSQDTEFYSGPKLTHDGPIRIEATLMVSQDIEAFKEYLDKLTGILPLEEKKTKKLSEMVIATDIDNHADFLAKVENLVGEKDIDQDQLIGFLRENGFSFTTTEYLKLSKYNHLNILSKHKDFQWMVRMSLAKNPKSDKYDTMLAFGINLLERTNIVLVYLHNDFSRKMIVRLPDKPRETFKKTGLIKFPHYMTPEERDKFRIELRALSLKPDRLPSKFFNRWLPYVENVPQLPNLTQKKDVTE